MVRSHPSCSVSQGRCWPVPLSWLPIFKVGHAGHKGFTAHTKRHSQGRQKPQGPTRAGRSHGEGGGPPEPFAAQSGPHREGQAVTIGCSEVSLHALLQLLEFLHKLLCLFVGAAFQHP